MYNTNNLIPEPFKDDAGEPFPPLPVEAARLSPRVVHISQKGTSDLAKKIWTSLVIFRKLVVLLMLIFWLVPGASALISQYSQNSRII